MQAQYLLVKWNLFWRHKMLRKILCLAATALFTQAASANVVYTWQQVEHVSTMPDGLHLELIFSDAAVAKRNLTLDFANLCSSAGYCEEQQDSLMSLRYWYAGPDGDKEWNLIDYKYRDEALDGYQQFSMSLQFLEDGHLSGSIMANSGFSDFTMQSDGTMFTMMEAHSDEGEGCGFAYSPCSGERGLLLSSAAVLPQAQRLPEPGSLAILAVGGLAGWFVRRRGAIRKRTAR
ncbi:PEP-CTERM sorting domain-containing protein [Massilia aerilata]|uniref:PEP-CTERM sorting domain-containing protein n=1 Tax=Massilia aerilata TaxID=453817 RepID=A0ABW0S066_9BURK